MSNSVQLWRFNVYIELLSQLINTKTRKDKNTKRNSEKSFLIRARKTCNYLMDAIEVKSTLQRLVWQEPQYYTYFWQKNSLTKYNVAYHLKTPNTNLFKHLNKNKNNLNKIGIDISDLSKQADRRRLQHRGDGKMFNTFSFYFQN